jgi:predicted transcriptional regulator
MANMTRPARVVTWNGKDVPAELRELPAGRYVVEAVDEEAPTLSADEEAGIEAGLESYRQGRVVDATRARHIIDAALGR